MRKREGKRIRLNNHNDNGWDENIIDDKNKDNKNSNIISNNNDHIQSNQLDLVLIMIIIIILIRPRLRSIDRFRIEFTNNNEDDTTKMVQDIQ